MNIEKYEQDLTAYWTGRDTVIKHDRAVIALVKPKRIQGFVQVVLNKPKVLFDTSVSILSSFEPICRMPWSGTDQDEAVRKQMSKSERAIIGIMREWNNNQYAMGRPSWLYELAYWACSGWVSWMPYVDTRDGLKFTCPFFDPLTVYPLWTNDGMEANLRRYYTTVGNARRMGEANGWNVSNLEGKTDTVQCKVLSLWEVVGGKVFNEVSFQGVTVKAREVTTFKEIPLKITPVAGTVEGPIAEGDVLPVARKGENIIAANRDVYEYQNKWTAFMMQIAQDVAYPNLLDYTEPGEAALKEEDLGSGKIHHRKVGEPIEVLRHAGTPGFELTTIINTFNMDEQRGGLPAIAWGSMPFEISGYMGSQLFAAVKYRLNPRLEVMRYVISSSTTESLRQFRKTKKKITLTVTETNRDKKRLGKGETFMEEFSGKDIPPTTYVDVDIPLATMVDKAQQMSWARQALSDPQLLSRETLWEDELGVQDIDQELRRIDNDMVNRLPGVQLIMAVERLKYLASVAKEEGNDEMAQAYLGYAQMMEQQIPGAKQDGGGQPGGPPSTGLPAEFGAGGTSPDMLASMEGRPPSGGTPGARTQGAASRAGSLWYPGKKE